MRLNKPVVSLVTMACTILAVVAVPGSAIATANYVYHESSGNDATGGNPVNCGLPQPYVNILTPDPGQAVTVRFKVEYIFDTDHLAVYYTTDGSHPQASYGFPASGATHVSYGGYACTFDNGQGIVDICSAVIPAQPAGTTVKY